MVKPTQPVDLAAWVEARLTEDPNATDNDLIGQWASEGHPVLQLTPENISKAARHVKAQIHRQQAEEWMSEHERNVPSISSEYALTDLGNAEILRDRRGDVLRYITPKHRWRTWNGHRWIEDTGEAPIEKAIEILREVIAEAQMIEDHDKRKRLTAWYLKSQNVARIKAMVELAKVMRPIADNGQDWDTNPYTLGVRNGVIQFDPNDGKATFRPGEAADKITQSVAVEYQPDAECPTWIEFRSQIHPEPAIREWVGLRLGASLTGLTTDQDVAVCYGRGSNGKSTELETVDEILGDYGWTAPHSTFYGRPREQGATNDLAGLIGKRFVIIPEIAKGTRTNEQRIKAVSAGDRQNARFLYGEFFQFVPQCKLWFPVNAKPIVRDESDGYWRRQRLVPYTQHFDTTTIPPRDDDLRAKLLAEKEGIFAWLVRCAERWFHQRGPAAVPAEILAATEAYRNESDSLRAFIQEACVLGADYRVGATDFRNAYTAWLRDNEGADATIPGPQTLKDSMHDMGYIAKRFNTGNAFLGIGLASTDHQHGAWSDESIHGYEATTVHEEMESIFAGAEA